MHRSDIHIAQFTQFQQWMDSGVLSEKAMMRLQTIMHYLEHDGSMAETAALFNTTPNALHRWINQFNPEDPSSLEDKSHRPRTLRTSQVSKDVVQLIRDYRIAEPKIGKEEIALRLQQKGTLVSASAIGRIIERECLYFSDSPLHLHKRLQARKEIPSVSTTTQKEVAAKVEEPALDDVVVITSSAQTSQYQKKWIVRTIVVSALLVGIALGYGTATHKHDALFTSTEASITRSSILYQP